MPRSYIKYPRVTPVSPWKYVVNLYKVYGFPSRSLRGNGVIGIGELGGGWAPADIKQFFKMNNLPAPVIVDVSVDGSRNNGNPNDPASAEVALDIMIAGSVYAYCTGKPAQIRVYWAKNAGTSIPSATQRAMNDGCDVMSWSWGEDELRTGTLACLEMDMVATSAAAAGMVTLAAAGDAGSGDSDPGNNVDSPASCPHVVSCGGTRKPHAGTETVWNDGNGSATGGGVSRVFMPMPTWQNGGPHFSGRMVPDVAANADPDTGYAIVLGGKVIVVGGTSAVAPLYAGLLAACGTKLGLILPKLWANQMAFNDIVIGNNGFYKALPGPDACTGLGSPIGGKFTALFK